ncbi:hypothetical protein [Frateuria defendens]|uniref:hypothetical protein n=1 Tax=Frateuria defendens TaxID=2219559 RepID=UPI00137921E2|nr:hypothetical protein [Frateuria defendens]
MIRTSKKAHPEDGLFLSISFDRLGRHLPASHKSWCQKRFQATAATLNISLKVKAKSRTNNDSANPAGHEALPRLLIEVEGINRHLHTSE